MIRLGCGERGMGKQLLLIRHGLGSRARSGCISRRRQGAGSFPLRGLNTPTGQKAKGLSQGRAGPEAQAKQQPTTQPAQLRTKQHLQPGSFPSPGVLRSAMTAGQQTTEGQAHLMVFASTRPTASIKGNSSGAAKGSRQALLQVDRSSE